MHESSTSGAREVHEITQWCTSKTLVDWAWVLQAKLKLCRLGIGPPRKNSNYTGNGSSRPNRQSTGNGTSRETLIRLGMRPPGEAGSRLGMKPPGQTLINWTWVLQEKAAPPQQSQDQGSRRWWSEDWREGAVVDAGAEVILPNLAEMKWACLYTQVQALRSTDT